VQQYAVQAARIVDQASGTGDRSHAASQWRSTHCVMRIDRCRFQLLIRAEALAAHGVVASP
jgi:hypothetical protein